MNWFVSVSCFFGTLMLILFELICCLYCCICLCFYASIKQELLTAVMMMTMMAMRVMMLSLVTMTMTAMISTRK